MKNIICIIARTNSTRLPHKTIREIHGKTMIEYIIDSMKEVKSATDIYVCTSVENEDQILLKIAEKNDIKGYAGSPKSVIDRILSVADQERADNVIRVTGDNIFTDPIMLEFALKRHMEQDADYTRVERLPLGVTGEVMKVNALKDCYQRIDPDKSEYLALFMFNPDQYKCLTVLPPEEFTFPFNSLTVDTVDDWKRTEFIFGHINEKRVYYGDIVELSRNHDIPYYTLSADSFIKLPDNQSVCYEKFREMYEEKIQKSIQKHIDLELYIQERKKKKIK